MRAAALLLTTIGCGDPPGDAAPAAPSGPPRTVLLVVMDTVRADHVGALGGRAGVTPHFDRLAAEGTLYGSAWAQAPWTLPSHTTLFTGLEPHEHGAGHARLGYDGDTPLLAERFRAAGFATGGFSNNPWVSGATGLADGFDVFVEPFRRAYRVKFGINRWVDPAQTGLPDAGGVATVQAFDGWLGDQADRPAFAFVNFIEAHLPYDPPAGFRGRFHAAPATPDQDRELNVRLYEDALAGKLAPADVAAAKELYDEEIAYVDARLGDLLAALDRRGRLDDALVIVTADHGEGFGEHRLDGVDLIEHQLSLYDEVLHVPLAVRWPGRVPVAREDRPVGLQDVAPFLGWALDGGTGAAPALLAAPADRALRASYAPPAGHRDLLADGIRDDARVDRLMARTWRAAREGGWKLLAPSDGPASLFDLGADPGETRDLSAAPLSTAPDADGIDVAARRAALEPRLPPPPALADGFAPSPETIEALRALGYVK